MNVIRSSYCVEIDSPDVCCWYSREVHCRASCSSCGHAFRLNIYHEVPCKFVNVVYMCFPLFKIFFSRSTWAKWNILLLIFISVSVCKESFWRRRQEIVQNIGGIKEAGESLNSFRSHRAMVGLGLILGRGRPYFGPPSAHDVRRQFMQVTEFTPGAPARSVGPPAISRGQSKGVHLGELSTRLFCRSA